MTSIYPESIKKVYLDSEWNVHIVNSQNRDSQITSKENMNFLKLAPDGETVAWLVMNSWTVEGDDGPGSEELTVYRNGKLSSVKCTLFIRDYWFWMNGAQIAIDCGGQHFAGYENLYDTTTMRQISSFNEAEIPLEKRPHWSKN